MGIELELFKMMWRETDDVYYSLVYPNTFLRITRDDFREPGIWIGERYSEPLSKKRMGLKLFYNKDKRKSYAITINDMIDFNDIEFTIENKINDRDMVDNSVNMRIFSLLLARQLLKDSRVTTVVGRGTVIGVDNLKYKSLPMDYVVEGTDISYFEALAKRYTLPVDKVSLINSLRYLDDSSIVKKYLIDSMTHITPTKTLDVIEVETNQKDIEYMKRATHYSKFGTCDRLQVGAVVVRDGDMIGTGFNSALAGTPTCNDVGHFMYDNSCKRTVHAEHNAIFAAIEAVGSIQGSVLYCTDRPCSDCMKLIATAGITKVYYAREYSPKYHLDLGVELIKLEV